MEWTLFGNCSAFFVVVGTDNDVGNVIIVSVCLCKPYWDSDGKKWLFHGRSRTSTDSLKFFPLPTCFSISVRLCMWQLFVWFGWRSWCLLFHSMYVRPDDSLLSIDNEANRATALHYASLSLKWKFSFCLLWWSRPFLIGLINCSTLTLYSLEHNWRKWWLCDAKLDMLYHHRLSFICWH